EGEVTGGPQPLSAPCPRPGNYHRPDADGVNCSGRLHAPGTESQMGDDKISDIRHDPLFQELVDKRTRFAWQLSAAVRVICSGVIAIIACAPQTLATPIGSGMTTVGIPVGLFVIVSSFVLTGIYV